MNEDGFLSRWSRRKAQARDGAVPAQAEPSAAVLAEPDLQRPAVAPAAPQAASPEAPPDTPATPLPTMDDVAKLTRESDFSAYVAQGVDENVQRAAMKKLFADPRYNVMDGLDVYIDDYTQSAPIPPALLRKMTQAAVLKLFDDETETPAPGAGPVAATPDLSEGAADEDPDLRLQPDDAAGRPGPAEGTRA
jgi:hypothetical protein